jgi:hypothetical protein
MVTKFSKAIMLGALALQFAIPLFALADVGGQKTGDRDNNGPRTEMGAQFCSRLASFGAKTDQDLYGRETKLKANREERGGRIKEQWGQRDASLKSERMKRDENIQKHFDTISARSLTDAQKDALLAFKSAYTSAVSVREAAVDRAIETYRDGVASALAAHQSDVDAAISTFQNAVKAAKDKAVADCGSGIAPQAVRQALTASLQNAKDALQTELQGIDNRSDAIKPLIEARNQAVQAALDAFKATIKDAREALQAAFPLAQK